MAISDCSALTSDIFTETEDVAFEVSARWAPTVLQHREPHRGRVAISEDATYAHSFEVIPASERAFRNVPETSVVCPWAAHLSLQGQWATRRWKAPCEEMFRELAHKHPKDLVALVESGVLTPGTLTFAAEALGETGIQAVAGTLMALLRHRSPMVREGALYGLHELAPTGLSRILKNVAHSDPSEAVRTTATELLGDE